MITLFASNFKHPFSFNLFEYPQTKKPGYATASPYSKVANKQGRRRLLIFGISYIPLPSLFGSPVHSSLTNSRSLLVLP